MVCKAMYFIYIFFWLRVSFSLSLCFFPSLGIEHRRRIFLYVFFIYIVLDRA